MLNISESADSSLSKIIYMKPMHQLICQAAGLVMLSVIIYDLTRIKSQISPVRHIILNLNTPQ